MMGAVGRRTSLCFGAVCIAGVFLCARAQAAGAISGTVLDSTAGTPVSGVLITLSLWHQQGRVNWTKTQIATTRTDNQGHYSFNELAINATWEYYIIDATLAGFHPTSISGIGFDSTGTQIVDFRMLRSAGVEWPLVRTGRDRLSLRSAGGALVVNAADPSTRLALFTPGGRLLCVADLSGGETIVRLGTVTQPLVLRFLTGSPGTLLIAP